MTNKWFEYNRKKEEVEELVDVNELDSRSDYEESKIQTTIRVESENKVLTTEPEYATDERLQTPVFDPLGIFNQYPTKQLLFTLENRCVPFSSDDHKKKACKHSTPIDPDTIRPQPGVINRKELHQYRRVR